MKELTQQLREAGLTGNEAKIYLELLKNKNLTAKELAKNTKIDRTLTYTLLDKLINKGLVSHITKEHKKVFQATKPQNLLNPIKEKELSVTKLITQLNKIQKEQKNNYDISVLEGKEGLQSTMNIVLKYKTIYSFGGTGRAYDQLLNLQAQAKELKNKKLNIKLIYSEKYRSHKTTKIKEAQIKFLDINSEATTTIFGECVSIHLVTKKPLIILIKNKEIAKSYKNYFELLWDIAKE